MNNMRFYKIDDGVLQVATITISQPGFRDVMFVKEGVAPHRAAAIKKARAKGFLPKEEIGSASLRKLPRTYVKVDFS